jgi:hypothetical protein
VGATHAWSAHDQRKLHESQSQSTMTWHYIFAQLAARSNNINDLRRT